MKALLLVFCLVCFGAMANAANMFVDFTKTPTAFNFDNNWDTHSSTATTFTGTFLANQSANGMDVVAIVNEHNPTELLDLLTLTFTTSTSDGKSGEETFSGAVVTDINGSMPIPVGAISELATGSPVDFTAALFAHGTFTSNITLQEKADSPNVPEPASLLLFGTGLLGLAVLAHRRLIKSAS